ncbi:adenylate/guanylate cyclase domain-containing protein [Nocardioides humilatus]|nr:adenylate/guanylate cyclase domain-containing protein [Nocardioides humilatus]
MDRAARPLLPYVPRLVVDWLEDRPDLTARSLDATAVFADISGFTNLTERLARRGKVGAEEMGDILNRVFGSLLDSAYTYGAELVKWGGDAVLLLFRGQQHPLRAAAAAHRMQEVIARVGRVHTSSGTVRLGMSIGLHSGALDCLLVGEVFRELIITGPDASLVARLEAAAEAGQVVVSTSTAAQLAAAGAVLGPPVDPGRLLLEPAPVVPVAGPGPTPRATDVELRRALPAPIAQHVVAADVAYEHRLAALCFLEFSDVDRMRETVGLDAVASAIHGVVSAAQRAAAAHDVTFLSTDIYPGGGKVILTGGVPTSFGDDTTRVLATAREILDGEHALPLRAGINVGRVFAGDYGTEVRRVYSVTGDAVNLAARLMAKAGPGELVVSQEALDRSRTRYQTRRLEPFAVKGKTQPVEASVVAGRAADPPEGKVPADPHLLPFVGRRRELSTLLDAYGEARSRRGSLVDLRGETGIGKSRLVHELLARAGTQAQWMPGDLYASGTPYAPFHRLVGADDLEQIVEDLAPHLRPLLPLLEIVAGVGTASKADLDRLYGDARKELMEGAASELLGRMFDFPTVWVFDDVQFMDTASTDLLNRLARDAADRPWLIITTTRDDSTWSPPDDAPAQLLTIRPLGASDAEDLITSHASGAAAPAHRFASVIERAEGNPLFLTELLEAMRVGALGSDESIELPDSVESAVAARIDQLAPSLRAQLRAAAVLGATVDLDLLATMSGAVPDLTTSVAAFDDLDEFLLRGDDGRYRFRHHLVQETAYQALPFRRRVALHAAAADAVVAHEPDDIVRTGLLSLHCLRGERYAEAYEHSLAAAGHAAAQYAHADAVTLHRRALEAARRTRLRGTEVVPVLEGLAEAYLYVGDLDAMEDTLRRARRAVDRDPIVLARLAALTTYQRRQTGRHHEAIRWTSRGRAALEGRTDKPSLIVLAELAFSRCQSLLARGHFAEAERWATRCIEEAEAAGDLRRRASATQLRAVARHYSGAEVDLGELVASAVEQERLGDLKRAARTHNIIGVLAFDDGLWPMALDHYDRAVDIYRRLSQPLEVALQLANAAELLIFQRRLDEAEVRLTEATRLWRGAPMNGEQAFGTTQRARCSMARGEYDAALALYEEARSVHAASREAVQLVIVEGMLAECLLLAGDARAAFDLILDVEARNSSAGADLRYLRRIRSLAQLGTGEEQQGLEQLRVALGEARAIGHLYDEWRCIGELVRLGAATADETAELVELEQAVEERLGVQVRAGQSS